MKLLHNKPLSGILNIGNFYGNTVFLLPIVYSNFPQCKKRAAQHFSCTLPSKSTEQLILNILNYLLCPL